MKWGLSTSLSGDLANPSLIAEVAAEAEEAGWDGVFVWDHLWNRNLDPFADSWVTLASMAAATESVRLGPLVTPLPRRRPQVVAQQANTLDRLSEGRLILGLGLGHDGYGEYSTFHEPLTSASQRAQALDEGLAFLKVALSGSATTIASAQEPRCPIWIAGTVGRPAGPRRVARLGMEGLALAGSNGAWEPQHVTEALAAGDLVPGSIEVALTGGDHPDVNALEDAGATWAVVELVPGTSASDALAAARQGPADRGD